MCGGITEKMSQKAYPQLSFTQQSVTKLVIDSKISYLDSLPETEPPNKSLETLPFFPLRLRNTFKLPLILKKHDSLTRNSVILQWNTKQLRLDHVKSDSKSLMLSKKELQTSTRKINEKVADVFK